MHKTLESKIKSKLGLYVDYNLKEGESIEYDEEGKPKYIARRIIKRYVGDTLLEEIVGDLISTTKALVLLDGLDEVDSNLASSIIEDVESINKYTTFAKIVISCRSGDYTYFLNGFNTMEICSLEYSDKQEIAKKWLGSSEEFFKELKKLPYQDLTDRPLFLTQLMVLFKNQGDLPDQPSSIYKKIVMLMIERWDQERKIHRASSYAGFSVDRKIEFLASLSYYLTYEIRHKVFSEDDLLKSYEAMYEDFRLPKDEALLVIREIEGHTGLIIQNGPDHYEFSHLSLQEYLCAYYIVRASFSKKLEGYLRLYPAPVAISVCISSNPTEWFQRLILEKADHYFTPSSAASFLSRLVVERPYFTRSTLLGLSLLKFCFRYPEETEKHIISLLSDQYILDSFSDALSYYIHLNNRDTNNGCFYTSTSGLKYLNAGHPQSAGFLPKGIVELITQNKEKLDVSS